VRLIAAPTGTGKTYAAAQAVAESGVRTCWLSDRHKDVAAVVEQLKRAGIEPAFPVQLRSAEEGSNEPNCLRPEVIEKWQEKGYDYRRGFCKSECPRKGDPDCCPFLASLEECKHAPVMVCTKALARRPDFFRAMGNAARDAVVLDEDPIGLLRPVIDVSREELLKYVETLGQVIERLERGHAVAAVAEAEKSCKLARFVIECINRQPSDADASPEAVPVPEVYQPKRKPGGGPRRQANARRNRQRTARQDVEAAFHRLMRRDPQATVRNVYRDLCYLAERSAGFTFFATATRAFFHLNLKVPLDKRVIVLDATANAELLLPIFAPKTVEVLCDDRVEPAGRVIQFMDANGPRSYLNKTPKKIIGIIDAIGDLHPEGTIVLISHKSCVEKLQAESRHKDRIKTAHFGALRGRNDLEPSPTNKIACHVVVGSPKTTETDRQQLALAVYGAAILPLPKLRTVRRAVVGRVPLELAEDKDAAERVWEVRMKGYEEPRMRAVYEHTVTAELTQAADRARVLIHEGARVYLVTNEPCPRLWFVETCYAGDFLDLTGQQAPRSDCAKNYAAYEAKAKELLDAGGRIGNADVCRALGKRPCAGLRYWQRFVELYGDALEGARKFRWKHSRADTAEPESAADNGPQSPPNQQSLTDLGDKDGPYRRLIFASTYGIWQADLWIYIQPKICLPNPKNCSPNPISACENQGHGQSPVFLVDKTSAVHAAGTRPAAAPWNDAPRRTWRRHCGGW
jgi:hypothetical protein